MKDGTRINSNIVHNIFCNGLVRYDNKLIGKFFNSNSVYLKTIIVCNIITRSTVLLRTFITQYCDRIKQHQPLYPAALCTFTPSMN